MREKQEEEKNQRDEREIGEKEGFKKDILK